MEMTNLSMGDRLRRMLEEYKKSTKNAFEPDYMQIDPIVHVLTHFKIGADLKRKGKKFPRLIYDADASYFSEFLDSDEARL